MKFKAIPSLVLVMVFSGLGMETPNQVAKSLAASVEAKNQESAVTNSKSDRIAQMFFPSANEPASLKVLGQGNARVPADTARVELSFSENTPEEVPSSPEETPSDPEETPSSEQTSAVPKLRLRSRKVSQRKVSQSVPDLKATPTSAKERLKPVVDALVAIGIPASAIKVNASTSKSGSFPFPFPSSSGSNIKVLVTIKKPTHQRVEQVSTVAGEVAKNKSELLIQNVEVKYSVSDCQPLVKAAYLAAVKDARMRAEAIASGMGVRIQDAPSISDSFLYDLFVPLCSAESNLPSFLPFGDKASAYDPDAPVEVQLRRDIFVTFRVK